jgi:hypothetical protein
MTDNESLIARKGQRDWIFNSFDQVVRKKNLVRDKGRKKMKNKKTLFM